MDKAEARRAIRRTSKQAVLHQYIQPSAQAIPQSLSRVALVMQMHFHLATGLLTQVRKPLQHLVIILFHRIKKGMPWRSAIRIAKAPYGGGELFLPALHTSDRFRAVSSVKRLKVIRYRQIHALHRLHRVARRLQHWQQPALSTP
jgi:hypothetical protein